MLRKLKRIPWKSLKLDHRYQAHFSESRAIQIACDFKVSALGVIHVAERNQGYFIIDGQHRVAALSLLDLPPKDVLCLVYSGLTPKEEGDLFVRLNTARKPRILDRFNAARFAGHEDECRVAGIIEKHGWKIASDRSRDGLFAAVGNAMEVYRGFRRDLTRHPEVLDATMAIIVKSWGLTLGGACGPIVAGIGQVVMRHGVSIDTDRLVRLLAKYPGGPDRIIGKARGLRDVEGGTVAINVAELIISCYNKGLRNGHLETIRKR